MPGENMPGSSGCTRTGCPTVMECPVPLRSLSGAMTAESQPLSESRRDIIWMPVEMTPSSLVRRIFMVYGTS